MYVFHHLWFELKSQTSIFNFIKSNGISNVANERLYCSEFPAGTTGRWTAASGGREICSQEIHFE
jgi:hypothetical protein